MNTDMMSRDTRYRDLSIRSSSSFPPVSLSAVLSSTLPCFSFFLVSPWRLVSCQVDLVSVHSLTLSFVAVQSNSNILQPPDNHCKFSSSCGSRQPQILANILSTSVSQFKVVKDAVRSFTNKTMPEIRAVMRN